MSLFTLFTASSASKITCAFSLEFSHTEIDLPNPVLNIEVAQPSSKRASSSNSFVIFLGSRIALALLIERLLITTDLPDPV
uniref:Uncharacterized protein n=1 Tax=Arundo donax TaxID=35708 RepID=A0A0A9DBQ7_ARUDO